MVAMSRSSGSPRTRDVELREFAVAQPLMKDVAMLRLLLLLVAACGPGVEDDLAYFPDGNGCPYVGSFAINSPVPDLHYSPHLDVHIDSAELYLSPDTSLVFSMIDDTGASYQWTTFASHPRGDNELWTSSVFHYELPPSHRFTLTVSYCDGRQVLARDFFTSAE